MITLRILLARRLSKRLAHEARVLRRALRDHQREQSARICSLEQRSRGLRLYTAWASGSSNVIQSHTQEWHATTLIPPELDSEPAAA
jgi:hypothetical protein